MISWFIIYQLVNDYHFQLSTGYQVWIMISWSHYHWCIWDSHGDLPSGKL